MPKIRSTENEVNGLLYNFGKFVNGAKLECREFSALCFGRQQFCLYLETTSLRSINGKKVLMKRVAKPQDSSVRILFISSSQQTRLKEILGN